MVFIYLLEVFCILKNMNSYFQINCFFFKHIISFWFFFRRSTQNWVLIKNCGNLHSFKYEKLFDNLKVFQIKIILIL